MFERKCPVCDTLYPADPKRLKHGRQTTCSRACSYKLRAQKKSKSITKPCAVCGTPVTRPPSKIARSKTEAFLCSPECHYAARADGTVGREVSQPYNIPEATRKKMGDALRQRNALRKTEGRYVVSEDTKKKLSITTSKAIAEGRIPRVSKLELEVGRVLQSLGVDAQHQHRMRGVKGRFAAVVDYFIPSLNTALEVNGTFWHADPREFPNGPFHASQRRTLTRYQRKMDFLRQRGITLAEVWEIDFKADPINAVKEALGLH